MQRYFNNLYYLSSKASFLKLKSVMLGLEINIYIPISLPHSHSLLKMLPLTTWINWHQQREGTKQTIWFLSILLNDVKVICILITSWQQSFYLQVRKHNKEISEVNQSLMGEFLLAYPSLCTWNKSEFYQLYI